MNTKAHCLGMTGTHKQQSYGHIAQGASETQVRKMRRNLKAGTNLGRTQSCLSTALAWIYGSSYDPEVSTRVEQVAYWIDVWKTFGENKKRGSGMDTLAAQTWGQAKQDVESLQRAHFCYHMFCPGRWLETPVPNQMAHK